MNLLIKLGGTLLDAPESRRRLAREIAAAANHHRVVLVHGGGKQLTRFLLERGTESRFVGGLRVTTPEIMDAVVQIFAGLVNTQLVAALAEAGARPVGLTGADAGLVHAVPLSPELGNVGKINQTNPEILNLLTAHGLLPVVACLAGGAQGELYNVNADQMAVACAVAFQAGRLIFLTDVEGVLDAEKRRLPSLTGAEALALIERGVAAGGMEAKLRACLAAVGQGVEAVQIAPGAKAGVLEELLAGCPIGTTVRAA